MLIVLQQIVFFVTGRTQNENEMDGFKHTIQYYLNNYPLEAFCVKPFKEVT